MSDFLNFGGELHLDGKVQLFNGDSREVLKLLPDASVDSVVTDPPYALVSIVKRFGSENAAPATGDDAYSRASAGFMGKTWDTGETAFAVEFWAEVMRVLKPGGHVVAASGTRTYHRLAVAIEDAGFEIRDMISWLYGCLDEETEAATISGVKPYHKIIAGDLVLCYDTATGWYSYQPVQEVVVYDYEDTAYRLIGDFGEQVVSRNHRCIVERDGREAFVYAESLQPQERVPVLESLPALQQALRDGQPLAESAEPILRTTVQEAHHSESYAAIGTQNDEVELRDVRGRVLQAERLGEKGYSTLLQHGMQREGARDRVGETRAQGAGCVDGEVAHVLRGEDDGAKQPRLERRRYLPEPQGQLREPADQIRSVPSGAIGNGPKGRLCHGASADCSAGNRSGANAHRNRPPHQPSRDGQRSIESDAVCDQSGPQEIRGWGGHKTAMVRVVPFQKRGKVWCLRVPTGAFVAVRNGVAFPTGNSGFPKSHDVSKGIDKSLGAERDVVGFKDNKSRAEGRIACKGLNISSQGDPITAPATPQAAQWQGWGTALKPACEPWVLARKPFKGTVAGNVLAHGTGAINVDGCRVGSEGGTRKEASDEKSETTSVGGYLNAKSGEPVEGLGRWPANVIHDGSDEVVSKFPSSTSTRSEVTSKPGGVYGGGASLPSHTGIYGFDDSGSAARFFYSAKADKMDRIGSKHPTVKPVDLMQYLCRLITPPGGIVLDPFAGSGSTGEAAWREGFRAVLIERETEYADDIRQRLKLANQGLSSRKRAITKQERLPEDGLFGAQGV